MGRVGHCACAAIAKVPTVAGSVGASIGKIQGQACFYPSKAGGWRSLYVNVIGLCNRVGAYRVGCQQCHVEIARSWVNNRRVLLR